MDKDNADFFRLVDKVINEAQAGGFSTVEVQPCVTQWSTRTTCMGFAQDASYILGVWSCALCHAQQNEIGNYPIRFCEVR